MKKFALIIGLIIFTSCSTPPEKQLVSNYEQRIGNTPTDLNLKFQKFEFIKDLTGRDSAIILTKYFEEKKLNKITIMQEGIDINNSEIESYKKVFTDQSMVDLLQEPLIKQNERSQSIINLYNGDCKGTFLEPILIKISDFESKPDSILAKEYNVTYTILNPMLNNVKQTISKTYFINTDITKILKAVTEELKQVD